MYYDILASIKINTSNILWKEWLLFQSANMETYQIEIDVTSNFEQKYGVEILPQQFGNAILRSENYFVSVNSDWSRININIFDEKPMASLSCYKILNVILFSYLSTKQVVQMHAALVALKEGIMFLGPSGIGKTTQAELWLKYWGAEIINGDMVFIKQESDRFLGCGSPWHGSSPYCMNKQVPLKALIVLKQSSENKIRRLIGFEMVSSIMNSVFFPIWYQNGHEAVCKTLDALLQTVPVYELSCRPDEDAVRLTKETVFGNT